MSLLDNRVLTLDSANPAAGPIAPAIDIQLSPRSDTYLSLDNNIRSKIDTNFIPTINAQRESDQQYVNDKYVNFTGREQIMPTVVEQISLKGHNNWNNLSINDAKTTTNQTTLYSASGNPEREDIGSNWWRYNDNPKTTTNQTTEFAYSANPEREDLGSNWWRYSDMPLTTINETQLFSYAGDVAGTTTSHIPTNRVQYTGTIETLIDSDGNKKEYKSANSGVTKNSKKATTLLKNYMPGSSGVTNIQLDASEKIGSTILSADWDLTNTGGNGTYLQAVPNATLYQSPPSTQLIGETLINPNKIESLDSRQTANYLIEGLMECPFSIYQSKSSEVPVFFADTNTQDTSGVTRRALLKEPIKPSTTFGGAKVFENSIYDQNQLKLNLTCSNTNIENPLLYGENIPTTTAQFMGKAYSGTALKGNSQSPPILLDTDSYKSSTYLNYFSPNLGLKIN